MSSPLALAGVTTMLMDRLNEGMLNNIFSPVDISAKSPDKVIQGNGNESAQLNIFLYHVTPNTGWRNAELPSRSSSGQRLTNPPLALDLHYLISAYGELDAETDLLLGSVMHLLHEMPGFTREEIRKSLLNGGLPSHLQGIGLDATGLADQMELIKITPEYLNTEEMSKLWSAIQSNYRPSVTYMVTVVLIHEERPTRSPLPVLTRGRNDTGPTVQPHLIPPVPEITSIKYPHQQLSARQGDTISIHGHHLDGSNIRVVFSNPNLSTPIEVSPGPDPTATQLNVFLDPLEDWIVGVYTMFIRVERSGESFHRLTNEVPFILVPSMSLSLASRSGSHVTVTIDIVPDIQEDQTASLFMGEHEMFASAHPSPTGTLVFEYENFPDGDYPARLRIDGVESWLINKMATPLDFDSSQIFTVPTP